MDKKYVLYKKSEIIRFIVNGRDSCLRIMLISPFKEIYLKILITAYLETKKDKYLGIKCWDENLISDIRNISAVISLCDLTDFLIAYQKCEECKKKSGVFEEMKKVIYDYVKVNYKKLYDEKYYKKHPKQLIDIIKKSFDFIK